MNRLTEFDGCLQSYLQTITLLIYLHNLFIYLICVSPSHVIPESPPFLNPLREGIQSTVSNVGGV